MLKNKLENNQQYEFQNIEGDLEMQTPDTFSQIAQSQFKNQVKQLQIFFNQQIHVQPPEGLISSLNTEGSWAPSLTTSKSGNLKDMKIRAAIGVQSGDIKKEAHMAFCLGTLNEEKKDFSTAIKYYK